MGGVLQGNAADAVLFGQGHSAVHAEGGVQGTNAQVAIVVLNSALRTDQFGLGVDVDPALLDVLGKARHTVQAVALDALEAALGMDLSALFSLLRGQAQIQECLLDGRFDGFIRYANTHIHSLLFDQCGGLVVFCFFLLCRMFTDISAHPLVLSA